MHSFHTERTANIMEAMYKAFCEEAINLLEKSGIDFYGLFRWHIERTLSIVDTLKYCKVIAPTNQKGGALTKRIMLLCQS